ncbi:D-methionine transport system ATP-binding protein [Aneurinibacillus soli]|uniref:Methionine import ATP-binding protein MetN n=1 Tax=Aneurinibacillus soli TaxID=1500254 RepID=A0A0U4NM82_9BACL|nr:methionine ABC transporter ATP-binding protein [Aneurinibacillus soli]PYE61948.1 D-methionine transport system ATP-binding protein [Aneurinibacillus soli]BAU29764.1 Methionine import ATP-binding protein MetN [Aneurinibacillus soli]
MIEIQQLTKEYRGKKSTVKGVDDVTLTIKKGEIFGIIGYSGAGKSSLLRCLNMLETPTSGKILIDGVDITKLKGKDLRHERLKIGMIFQHFHLISSKTVTQNVAFALKAAGKSKEEIERRVPELLDLVGLGDKGHHYPAQLSGGQKQRVGIARALANNPKVLLCDEATSALDPSTTRSILALLKEINRTLGITIVLITHEMEVVKEICHRIAVMQNGKVIESGDVYELFARPVQPLTRDFIDTVLHFSLPDKLLENRRGTLVKINFQGEIAEKAVVSEVLKKFNVEGNILHGKIEYIQDEPLGIFIMELIGDSQEIARAIEHIRQRTAGLEVLADAA